MGQKRKTKTKTWFGSKVKRQRQRHDVGLKTKTRTWCGSKHKNYKLSPEKDNGSAFLLCLYRNPYRGDQGSLALQPTTHQQWKDRFALIGQLGTHIAVFIIYFLEKGKGFPRKTDQWWPYVFHRSATIQVGGFLQMAKKRSLGWFSVRAIRGRVGSCFGLTETLLLHQRPWEAFTAKL